MEESVTMQKIGYHVEGEVELQLWGGSTARVKFNKFEILDRYYEGIGTVAMCIDDGGFGCEKILSADVTIKDLYEHGFTYYSNDIHIDEETMDRYNFINSKYIKDRYKVDYPDQLEFFRYN